MCDYWSRSNHLSYVGKMQGKFSELFKVFLVFSNISFFLWVKTFALCLSVFTLRRMDASFGRCDFWDCFWGGRGISYDWSVVFKATINQSQVTPIQMIPEIIVPKACTHSP